MVRIRIIRLLPYLQSIFRIKQKNLLHINDETASYQSSQTEISKKLIILRQFSPKIVTKTRHFDCKQFLTSRRSTRVFGMGLGTSFVSTLISIGRKALPFQRLAEVDKKLH